MNSAQVDNDLKKLENSYKTAFSKCDNDTAYYILQMVELMYNELSYEVYDKEKLYDLVCNGLKNNIVNVFNNLRDYHTRYSTNLVNEFSKLIKVSLLNTHISSNNLINVFNNFKNEIGTALNLDNKIKVLISSNGNLLLEQVFASCVVVDNKKVTTITEKYISSISDEMIKNIALKNESLLSTYKSFVEEVGADSLNEQDKLNRMNLKIINETTYTFLKEQEYFIIEKYYKSNIKAIESFFNKIEAKANSLGGKKNKGNKLSNARDYFYGFNNTIRVKAQNIFDEMNQVITMDNNSVNAKIKEFTNLISHIYELNIKFDKQYANYKKDYSIPTLQREKYNKFFDGEANNLTNHIKLSISNIFRENTNIYNNIVYKSVLLKSRLNEFTEVLSEQKVKDLLTK